MQDRPNPFRGHTRPRHHPRLGVTAAHLLRLLSGIVGLHGVAEQLVQPGHHAGHGLPVAFEGVGVGAALARGRFGVAGNGSGGSGGIRFEGFTGRRICLGEARHL